MKAKQYKGSWRSDRTEKKFRVADDARWERATATPPEAIDVATSFGSTKVHRWPGNGADIVFLHGMGDTSIRWVPFAEVLAEHNVHAIDIMGDVGRSTPEIGFESANDYGTWLAETIGALGLSAPHVVGHSLGGYIALSHAVQRGEAGSFVLFDPVGVVELRLLRFIGWGAMTMLGALAPGPVRRWAARRLRHPVLNDKADVRLLLQGQLGHPPKLPPLPVFTDAQLASIDRPVRLVAGAESSAFDVAEMVRRIADLVDDSQARQLPDAGHALVMSHLDECVAEIRAAVAGDTASQPSG